MSISLRTLKGVGEKTEKLFAKIGVTDMESLLSYYPRNYDAYEEPVEIRSLEEGAVVAISVAVITGVYVNQVRNLQVITTTVADLTGKISVTWFNAPYLRSAVRKGSRFVLRGRVVRKQGKLQMEHPEIFTPAAYEEILHSLQPIYALTAGLSNKMIVKLLHQVLEGKDLEMEYLADDLVFLKELNPHMVGIGPFIPHHDTKFAEEPAGSVDLTLFLLSVIRIMLPQVLLPATTALGTLDPRGREKGFQAGANVVMPNLSPVKNRKQYELYDNKICTGEEAAECRGCLSRRVESVGYEIVTDRGDSPMMLH